LEFDRHLQIVQTSTLLGMGWHRVEVMAGSG
jgi:hypothetical protein